MVVVLLHSASCQQMADKDDLQEHLLDPAFSQKRSHLSPENKQLTVDYIYKFWKDLTSENVELLNQTFPYSEDVNGINFILVVKGTSWGTSEDKPSVLGAHYDSVSDTAGKTVNKYHKRKDKHCSSVGQMTKNTPQIPIT